MNTPQQRLTNTESPQVVGALIGFIKWAALYGHELVESAHVVEQGIARENYPVFLGLSSVLSASINFGYDPSDQSIFMALDKEEYAWLPQLPIEEIVIGRQQIYVMTRPMVIDGDSFEPMAIAVQTGQPKLWRAFPGATTIGFMCVEHSDSAYEVAEFAQERFPLRFLND